jgi:hypothetical protein
MMQQNIKELPLVRHTYLTILASFLGVRTTTHSSLEGKTVMANDPSVLGKFAAKQATTTSAQIRIDVFGMMG